MCRHLAYLGPPVALDDLAVRPRRTRSRTRPSARGTRRRATPTPTAGASPGTTRPRTAPDRYRTVTPIWDDHDVRGTRGVDAQRRVPRRGAAARRPARRSSTTGNAPFVDGHVVVLAQRHRRTASPTASATSCAPASSPSAGRASSATPTPRCCSRSCSQHLDAGHAAGRRARRPSCTTSLAVTTRSPQPPADRRRASCTPRASATRCSGRGPRDRVRTHRRRRRAGCEIPDRTRHRRSPPTAPTDTPL